MGRTLMWDLMKQVCGAMGVRTTCRFTNSQTPNATSSSTGRPRKAHPLQGEEGREFRRTRLHLLQCRVHGGKLPRQSEGREGLASRGEMRKALPRLRWHAYPWPRGSRSFAGSIWHEAGAMTLDGKRWHGSRACLQAFPKKCGRWPPTFANRSESWLDACSIWARLSGPRPRRRHALDRRTPARAARPRGAQSHHGRAVCDGRAIHRPSSSNVDGLWA